MTSQEVFDAIVTHLRAQGTTAQVANGSCVYKTKDGLKCAAGCLIQDEEYFPEMEGKSFSYLLHEEKRTPHSLVGRLEKHAALIMEMQKIHDDYQPEDWEVQFRSAARMFRLHYNTPPQGK